MGVLLDEAVLGLWQASHLVVGYCDVGTGDSLEIDCELKGDNFGLAGRCLTC